MKLGLHLSRGMRVGLYGGSFDPAHEAHAQVAQTARKRLGLHKVVWLVSPGNPLKPKPGDLARRLARARAVAPGPSMIVSGIEADLGVCYTVDTLRALKRRYPGVHFVWIMGADSLAGFHRWKAWRAIFRMMPVAVVARPGSMAKARFSPAARQFAHARRAASPALPLTRAPAWADLPQRLNPLSSSALRRKA